MPFPSAPWRLSGRLCCSLFLVGSGARAGLHVVAFADYAPSGVLGYRELLVARPARDGLVPRARITDIWVDSPASLQGGRALWAIPKELAAFTVEQTSGRTSEMTARSPATALASARFRAGRWGARSPYAFIVDQLRDDGSHVVSGLRGHGTLHPATAVWEFDGPLAWLTEARQLGSFVLEDFSLTFG
jgi:acetoacetate decarboxylase